MTHRFAATLPALLACLLISAAASADRARLTMSVDTLRPDVAAAQADTARIVRDFLAQAHQLGARDEDLSTAGFSVRAEYDYVQKPGGSNERRFLGYRVTRGIEVVVRNLDKVGDFLQKATAAGINNVSDPVLESSQGDD